MVNIKVTKLPDSENIEIKKLEFSDQAINRFGAFLASLSNDDIVCIEKYDSNGDPIGGYSFNIRNENK